MGMSVLLEEREKTLSQKEGEVALIRDWATRLMSKLYMNEDFICPYCHNNLGTKHLRGKNQKEAGWGVGGGANIFSQ